MIMNRLLAAGITNPVLPPIIGQGGNAAGGPALGLIITNLISGMFIIAFVVAFIYLLTGALGWITSGGDKGNLESARNKIIHAIVGLIVVATAFAIMNLVGAFLGINFQKLPIPSIDGNKAAPAGLRNGDSYTITCPGGTAGKCVVGGGCSC